LADSSWNILDIRHSSAFKPGAFIHSEEYPVGEMFMGTALGLSKASKSVSKF